MQKTNNRLSLTFHNTFAPEVPYLAKIMEFAAGQGQGDKVQISNTTGIPTGPSSGKVEPTISYAYGMGLIHVERGSDACFALSLTDLGREVYEQDRYLKEDVTQWLLHLMFCRRAGGAEAWYKVFAEGDLPLGKKFSSDDIAQYLKTKKENVSPLWRMYSNESGLALCHALEENEGLYSKNVAPISSQYFYVYSYFLLSLLEENFSDCQQVNIDNLEKKTLIFSILGFGDYDISKFLDWMKNKRYIDINRQTGEVFLLKLERSKSIIVNLYDYLV